MSSNPSSRSSSASPNSQILAGESGAHQDSARDDTRPVTAIAISPSKSAPARPSASTPEVRNGDGASTEPIQMPEGDSALIQIPYSESGTAQAASSPHYHADSTQNTNQQQPHDGGQDQPAEVADGRVKNPVPNKLQNTANENDGNFSIMRMHAKRKAVIDERSLAAKRSSEATQAAAMNAQKHYYQPLKERKQAWKSYSPGTPSDPAPPLHQTPRHLAQYQAQVQYHHAHSPAYHHHTPAQHPYMSPPNYGPLPPRGPTPGDVKSEQARLLTFLRSLHPVIVVDQLCKALAYFGGIPGAPPPPDQSGFPQSDRDNGSGAIIVGWLSEIFPPADLTKPQFSTLPGEASITGGAEAGHDGSVGPSTSDMARRPRGRPKGSKSSKFRKDKGIKKGPRVPLEGQAEEQVAPTGEGNNAVESSAHTRPSQPLLSNPTSQDSLSAPSTSSAVQTNAAPPPTSSEPLDPDSSTMSNPGKRKRGRPKGSKNRPRVSQPQPYDPARPRESPTPAIAMAAVVDTSSHHSLAYNSTKGGQRTKPTSETTLSHHAQNWAQPPAQSPQQDGWLPDVDNSGKWKSDQLAQSNDMATELGQAQEQTQAQDENRPRQIGLEGAQGANSKRRRLSKETRPASTTSNLESQLSCAETSVSPAMNPSISNSETPTPSCASFGSQSPSSRQPNMGLDPGQMAPLSQQPFQPPPQKQLQQQRNQPPSMDPGQQNDAVSRKVLPHSLSQPQTSNRPHQNRYGGQQRQSSGRFSHLSNLGPNNLHNTPGANSSSAQFSNSQQQRQPPASTSGTYFNTMQYALSASRAVQQSGANSAFGGQAQFGTTMPETAMEERLYDAFGRR